MIKHVNFEFQLCSLELRLYLHMYANACTLALVLIS